VLLYSADAISGSWKSACRNPWIVTSSWRGIGALSLQLKFRMLGWFLMFWPMVSADSRSTA
jgi:hypothetical protein